MSADRFTRAVGARTSVPGEVLALLLEAWRERRALEIADAIDRISVVAVDGRARIKSDREWLAVARRDDAGDLPRLVTALAEGVCKDLRGRLARLAERGADPRLTRTLLTWLADLGRIRRDHHAWLRRTIVDIGDVRALPRLREQVADVSSASRKIWMPEELCAPLEALPRPELTATEKAELEALVQRIETGAPVRARRFDAQHQNMMLRAIWAEPDADGPREIFADWLQEQGNPYGEFIALQFARHRGGLDAAGGRRERDLLLRYKRLWLGPLAPGISTVGRARFERGFVVAADIDLRGADPSLELHAAWSTLREFRVRSPRSLYNDLDERLVKEGAVRKGYEEKFTRGIE